MIRARAPAIIATMQAVTSDTLIRAGTLAGLNFGHRASAVDFRDERMMQIVNLGDAPKYYLVKPQFAEAAGSLHAPGTLFSSTARTR